MARRVRFECNSNICKLPNIQKHIDQPQDSLFFTQITKFMGPTWGPPGSCRPQMDPMLAHEPFYQGMSEHMLCKE